MAMVLDRVKEEWGKFKSYLEGLGRPESRSRGQILVDELAELQKYVPTPTVHLLF